MLVHSTSVPLNTMGVLAGWGEAESATDEAEWDTERDVDSLSIPV